MATAVFFHAHPNDEALSTGGTMLMASQAGHRVVLVCATDGSRGETPGLDGSEEPTRIPSDSFMVALPDVAFEMAFGTEWFIRRGHAAADPPATDLFAALEPRPDPAAES